MKTKYLLPNYCKIIGKVITGLLLPLFIITIIGDTGVEWTKPLLELFGDFTYPITTMALMFGLLLVAFSREKLEDEYIAKIRSNSLVFAVISQNVIVILGTATIYNFEFFTFATIAQITTLLIFIIKFRIALSRFNKSC